MPTFTTRGPVSALVDVAAATLTVTAVDRPETTVDIRPHDPGRSADVELASRTTVELDGDRLVVRSPRSTRGRLRSLFGGGERIDLDVVLPAGSSLEVRGWGDLRCHGPLGAVDVDTAMGDLQIDEAARIRATTSMGDIRVASVTGPAELRSSAGSVRVGRATGDVTARTSAGDVRVDEGGGELHLSTSTGDVRVERAAGTVTARTSAGDVRLMSVRSGSVTASTSFGQLEIGVARGVAAWLDVEARHGAVRSELERADGPGDAGSTVEIHAHTSYGDILLRRT